MDGEALAWGDVFCAVGESWKGLKAEVKAEVGAVEDEAGPEAVDGDSVAVTAGERLAE